MAITVTTKQPGSYGHEEAPMETWTADRKLWLTADRERVVEDGDERASFLLVSAGKKLPLEEARRLGLVKQAAKPQDKQAAKPQDKQAAKPQDKQAAKPAPDKPRAGTAKPAAAGDAPKRTTKQRRTTSR